MCNEIVDTAGSVSPGDNEGGFPDGVRHGELLMELLQEGPGFVRDVSDPDFIQQFHKCIVFSLASRDGEKQWKEEAPKVGTIDWQSGDGWKLETESQGPLK